MKQSFTMFSSMLKSVSRYLANPDDNEIDEEEMLSIEEYQALEAEV